MKKMRHDTTTAGQRRIISSYQFGIRKFARTESRPTTASGVPNFLISALFAFFVVE